MSLSNTILDEIDSINESSFDATVSVCMSLFENYTKAIEMNMFAEQKGIELPDKINGFYDRFIQEADESIWRKNKADGTRENILISILLLPLRLIQALIKWIRNRRNKNNEKELNDVLTKVEEKVQEEKEQQVANINDNEPQQQYSQPKTFSSEKIVTVSTPSGEAKEEAIVVEVIPNKEDDKIISTNFSLTETQKQQLKLSQALLKYKDIIGDFVDFESARQMAKDALSRGLMNPVEASQFVMTVTGREEVTTTEITSGVSEIKNELTETERVCDDFERTVMELIKMIQDHPSGDSDLDDDVVRKLTELQQATSGIIILLGNDIKKLDAFIAACRDAGEQYLASRS